jgi:hypothetical protein
MTVADLNHDGVDDLIVSEPSFGAGDITDFEDYYPKKYEGRINIYLG